MFAVTCICGSSFAAHSDGDTIRCPACDRRLDRTTLMPIEPDFNANSSPVFPEGELRLRDDAPIRVEPIDPRFVWHDDGPEPYALAPEPDESPPRHATNPNAAEFYGAIGIVALKQRASCLAYGPSRQWALAGQGDYVQILNMQAGEVAEVFREHRHEVTSVAIASDGIVALSGDEAGNLLCWDLPSRGIYKRWLGPESAIYAIATSPDISLAVSGGADGIVRFWPMVSGAAPILPRDEPWDEPITALAFSEDGAFLFIGGGDGRVEAWPIHVNGLRRRFIGLAGAVTSFHHDGRRLTATANPEAKDKLLHPPVCRWELHTGKPCNPSQPLSLPRCIPSRAVLDPAGKRLIVAGRYSRFELGHYLPGRALVADLAKDFRDGVADFFGVKGESDEWSERFLPDAPPALEIWSLNTGRLLFAYANVRGQIDHIAVSPDNTRLLVSLADGHAQVFAMAGV